MKLIQILSVEMSRLVFSPRKQHFFFLNSASSSSLISRQLARINILSEFPNYLVWGLRERIKVIWQSMAHLITWDGLNTLYVAPLDSSLCLSPLRWYLGRKLMIAIKPPHPGSPANTGLESTQRKLGSYLWFSSDELGNCYCCKSLKITSIISQTI